MFSDKLAGILLVLPLWLGSTTPTHAYIDLAPTLTRIIADSQKIAVVEVVEFNREKHAVALKEVAALKGELAADPVWHLLAHRRGRGPAADPPMGLARCAGVLFGSRNVALVCVGQGWYQVQSAGAGPWQLGKDRPDLPLAYWRRARDWPTAWSPMLAGKDAVITVVAHGADNEAGSFDLALNRASLPGRSGCSGSAPTREDADAGDGHGGVGKPGRIWLGGGGRRERMCPRWSRGSNSADAMVRAEAADDLRSLACKARDRRSPWPRCSADPSPSRPPVGRRRCLQIRRQERPAHRRARHKESGQRPWPNAGRGDSDRAGGLRGGVSCRESGRTLTRAGRVAADRRAGGCLHARPGRSRGASTLWHRCWTCPRW